MNIRYSFAVMDAKDQRQLAHACIRLSRHFPTIRDQFLADAREHFDLARAHIRRAKFNKMEQANAS